MSWHLWPLWSIFKRLMWLSIFSFLFYFYQFLSRLNWGTAGFCCLIRLSALLFVSLGLPEGTAGPAVQDSDGSCVPVSAKQQVSVCVCLFQCCRRRCVAMTTAASLPWHSLLWTSCFCPLTCVTFLGFWFKLRCHPHIIPADRHRFLKATQGSSSSIEIGHTGWGERRSKTALLPVGTTVVLEVTSSQIKSVGLYSVW